MVKPGGTGRPMLVISARLAPLPPSRFFISARPSACPFPKKYTYFSAIASPLDFVSFNVLEKVSITIKSISYKIYPDSS
jgi:hypothetical protein